MPFSFPSNPSIGATSTQNGRDYRYAGGNVWELAASGGGSAALRTFSVTNSGSGAYLIDGSSNSTLTLERGQTYDFVVNASGHPFHFQTVPQSYSLGNLYTTGVTNGGTASGTIRFVVPYDAPATLYYVCQFHGSMGGTVNVVNANEDLILRSLFTPSAPTGLTATAGNAQASLSWTAPTGVIAQAPITDYVVQFSSNSGSSWSTFSDGTSTLTSATVTGLTNSTAHVFRVAAVNAVGVGAYSTASSAVTPTAGDPLFSSVQLLLRGDTSIADASAYSRSVTASGGAAVSTAQKKFGAGSIAFNGGAGTVVPAANAGYNLGSGDWVIEGWVYFNSVASDQRVGGGDLPFSIGGYNWAWYTTTSGRLDYYLSSSGSSWNLASGSQFGTIVANQWYHVALVRNGSTVTPYLNGTAGTTASVGSSSIFNNTSNGPFIGAQGTSYFNGFVDDFRVTVGNSRGYTGSTITVPTAAFPDGVMSAPTSLAATAGNAQVSLAWTAPSYNGGSAITDYSVQYSSNSGSSWTTVSRTASTTASQVVTGLTNGTAYVFRVAGINANGTGDYTAASGSVTPSSAVLSVSPATIIGSTPLPGVSYTFSGAGTAGDKLTSGAPTYRDGGNRFDAAAYQSHAFTCGVSGTLYFEWGPGGADDDGLYWASLTSYRRNGTVSTTFATAQLPGTAPFVGEGQQRRGISVSAGDVINLQQFVIERPGTPLRAWIE